LRIDMKNSSANSGVRQDFREIRSDASVFVKYVSDLREQHSFPTRRSSDLANDATITADLRDIKADLRDAAKERKDLRGDLRDLRTEEHTAALQSRAENESRRQLRELDRANQVAGDHGQQGRDNAMNRHDVR